MPLLPQPSTTSPGSLVLLYQVGALEHSVGSNLLAGVGFGDIDLFRDEADVLGNIVADLLTNISFITGWRICDPSGVSLYEEAFGTAKTGERASPSPEVFAQSATASLTGKGRPDIGLAQGQTKFTLFLGAFNPVAWNEARQNLTDGDIDFGPLRDKLNSSDVIGADEYGVKATWRNYWNPQINSYYQKTYGL